MDFLFSLSFLYRLYRPVAGTLWIFAPSGGRGCSLHLGNGTTTRCWSWQTEENCSRPYRTAVTVVLCRQISKNVKRRVPLLASISFFGFWNPTWFRSIMIRWTLAGCHWQSWSKIPGRFLGDSFKEARDRFFPAVFIMLFSRPPGDRCDVSNSIQNHWKDFLKLPHLSLKILKSSS